MEGIILLKIRDIELPSYEYLTAGNNYKGSRGKFRYNIIVDTKEGKVTASYWCGVLCSELSEMEETAEFPLNEEGHKAVTEWVVEKYYKKKEEMGWFR